MKKTFLVVILITALTFIISLYIYSKNRRYYIISTGNRTAYKIDRRTGRTWEIIRGRQILVEGSEELTSPQSKAISPQDKAIEMVKKSHAFGGFQTVENLIRDALEQKKGNLQITGWQAQRIDEQTYLVSYGLKDDTGTRAWHFEVNLAEKIVRNINADPELKKKYLLAVPEEQMNSQISKPQIPTFEELYHPKE